MKLAKFAIGIVGAGVAYLAGAAAMSHAFDRLNPALAARSPIGNGPALADLARLKLAAVMGNDPDNQAKDFPKDVPPGALSLAQRALVKEPLAGGAAAVIALKLNTSRGVDAARTLFQDAYRLNRRITFVTLWLARDGAMRGDVSDTLTHFDEVLRTSKDTRTLLLARFAVATSNPLFRKEMARLMRTRPVWADEFWAVAPEVPGAAKPVGELRLMLASSDLTFHADDDRKLIDQLLNGGEFELASKLYSAVSGKAADAPGEFVRNANFDRPTALPLADWQTYSIGDYGSEILPKEGLMLFSAITYPGGAVAREWVSLPPGTYRLSARMKTINRGREDRVLARLTCITGQASARTIDIPLGEGVSNSTFSVAPACREYWLDVVAAPAEGATGFDGELDVLSIRRAS